MINRFSFEAAAKIAAGAQTVFRGDAPAERIPKEDGYKRRNDYDDAMVCLTCTASHCGGEEGCYMRRKKALAEERGKNR